MQIAPGCEFSLVGRNGLCKGGKGARIIWKNANRTRVRASLSQPASLTQGGASQPPWRNLHGPSAGQPPWRCLRYFPKVTEQGPEDEMDFAKAKARGLENGKTEKGKIKNQTNGKTWVRICSRGKKRSFQICPSQEKVADYM